MGTLTGHYERPDGTPARGTLTFTMTARMVADEGLTKVIVVEGPVHAELDNSGNFVVELRPTDDPEYGPVIGTLTYNVLEMIEGRPTRIYSVVLPDPGPWDLAEVASFDSPPGVVVIPGGGGGGGLDQATADALYVNVTGDNVTGDLTVLGFTQAGSLAVVQGFSVQGDAEVFGGLDVAGGTRLAALVATGDVDFASTPAVLGRPLATEAFVEGALPTALDDLTDVDLSEVPVEGQVLGYDGSLWVPVTPAAGGGPADGSDGNFTITGAGQAGGAAIDPASASLLLQSTGKPFPEYMVSTDGTGATNVQWGDGANRPGNTLTFFASSGAFFSSRNYETQGQIIFQESGGTWAKWALKGTAAGVAIDDKLIMVEGGTSGIDALADVDTAGAVAGQTLGYDGALWVPVEPAGGGGGFNPVATPMLFDDFFSAPSVYTAPSSGFVYITAGTGASVGDSIFPKAVGAIQLATGTTAAGAEATVYTKGYSYDYSAGPWSVEARINLHSLSDAVETFTVSVGFGWRAFGGRDAISIVYDAQGKWAPTATASPNWLCLLGPNSGTPVKIDSGVPVVAGSTGDHWTTLKVEWDQPNSTARFYINGQVVADSPFTPSVGLQAPTVKIAKYLGTTSRLLYVDYIKFTGVSGRPVY